MGEFGLVNKSTEDLLRDKFVPETSPTNIPTDILIKQGLITDSTESLIHGGAERYIINALKSVEKNKTEGISEDLPFHLPSPPPDQADPGHEEIVTSSKNDVQRDLDDTSIEIIEDLYYQIEAFLVHFKLSRSFLIIFKNYVNILIQEGINPLYDEYFKTLEDELKGFFTFNSVIEEILEVFLIHPRNKFIALSLAEYTYARNKTRRYFNNWETTWELNVHAKKFANESKLKLMEAAFYIWSDRTLKYSQIANVEAESFRNTWLLFHSFQQWVTLTQTLKEQSRLADQAFLNKMFKKIIKARENWKHLETISTAGIKQITLRATFHVWKLKQRETNYLGLKRRFFGRIKQKLKNHGYDDSISQKVRSLFLQKKCFSKWKNKDAENESKLVELYELESEFIKQKFMRQLSRAFQYNQKEAVVKNKLDQTLLRCVFERMWLKRFQDHLHLYSLISLKETNLVKDIFHSWKKLLYIDLKASDYSRTNLLKSTLRYWKLHVKLKAFKHESKTRNLTSAYHIWRKRIQYEKKSNDHIKIVFSAKYLELWKKKVQQMETINEEASIFYERGLANECIAIWKERLIKTRELEDRYNFLTKTHAILSIKRTVMHINNVHLLYNRLMPSMNRTKLSRAFIRWRKASSFRIKHKLYDILHTYEVEKKYQLQNKLFNAWQNRYYFYSEECNNQAISKKSWQLEKMMLKKSKAKLSEIMKAEALADEVRKEFMLIKTFYVWKTHLDELFYMNTLLEQSEANKQFVITSKFLKMWSLRFLKIKRNDETVQVFRHRWDRATVRGLLLLWKNRSDNSPKRRKDFDLKRELKTPIRSDPLSASTIPGSERIKQHRMEAMKSHYSRARRAIPSPVKSSSVLDSTAKKQIKIEGATDLNGSPTRVRPIKYSPRRANRNLPSRVDHIDFGRIPAVPFRLSADSPKIERDQDMDYLREHDRSPLSRKRQ
ncbi:sfi1p [Saccharomyces arboricola H-6]|uniref:Sfi1p n=1 Tax=Saccharomyces arboricola (strain H-6 / AS 2.3317 / CBS 10644) TaxID=1160507 RepID=J8Q587_SACAR|nr:sfi1p [Saccharomyces arboricola H-6]